jgi:DNA-nicking Smr family endonuclease
MRPEIPNDDVPVELPMDGVLDLHTFRPRDVGDLVPEWLAACQERGLLELRIIHGKGIGNLQRSVHAILARHPEVAGFSLASAHFGGTGTTIVHLRPPRGLAKRNAQS